MDTISVFAPATVANVACGFDVLGFALEAPGDTVTLRRVDQKGIHIVPTVEGLPTDPEKNTAGIALLAMLADHPISDGLEVEISKGVGPGSGMGSSASSAAAAVVGLNELLGSPLSRKDLIKYGMEGERGATGAPHADNVAPALLGGFTLVRSYDPLEVLALPTPKELFAVILHPQIEVKTEHSRAMLREDIPLRQAIIQWGNLGGLISALYTEDYDLLGRCLVDVVVTPTRSLLIPGYADLAAAAREAGALGFSISGSGPSVFALCKGEVSQHMVAQALSETYTQLGIPFHLYRSLVHPSGCHIKTP